MKYFFIISFVSLSINAQTQFSVGYQDGYKDGYCYTEHACNPPNPPNAPNPSSNERSNNYKDGYQRGFLAGNNAKSKDNSSNKTYNQSNNYNKPREYGEYVAPYDFNLISYVLKAKERQYQNQNAKKIYYENLLNSTLSKSFKYYKDVIDYLKDNDKMIVFSRIAVNVEKLNPIYIYDIDRNHSLTYKQTEYIINELADNHKSIKKLYLYSQKILEKYNTSVDLEINRDFIIKKTLFQVYDKSVQNKYRTVSSTVEKDIIKIDKNLISIKLNNGSYSSYPISIDTKRTNKPNGIYILDDSRERRIVVDVKKNTIQIYFHNEPNRDGANNVSGHYSRRNLYFFN